MCRANRDSISMLNTLTMRKGEDEHESRLYTSIELCTHCITMVTNDTATGATAAWTTTTCDFNQYYAALEKPARGSQALSSLQPHISFHIRASDQNNHEHAL